MVDLSEYIGKSSPTISGGKDIFEYIGGIEASAPIVAESTIDTGEIKLEYTVEELSAYVDAARSALSGEVAYYDGIISVLESQLSTLESILESIGQDVPTTEDRSALKRSTGVASVAEVVEPEDSGKDLAWGGL